MVTVIITYLAGVLTVLSPCILPVLPFAFSQINRPFHQGALPMLVGLALTFGAMSTLVAVGAGWAVQASEAGRYLALVLAASFGVMLIFPRLAETIFRPAVHLGHRLSGRIKGVHGDVVSSAALGIATGLLWTPCAGPVLGLVLAGAALSGPRAETALFLTAYAAGAATSLAVVIYAGRKIFAAMVRSLGIAERIRQGTGILVIATSAAIAAGFETRILSLVAPTSATTFEASLLGLIDARPMMIGTTRAEANSLSQLPVEDHFPELGGATEWLNSAPLSREALRGKVVLVNFWTYSCINCIRSIPYIREWAERYKDRGLVVIGVHAPEFAFEKKTANVKSAVERFGITYPVLIDNDFKVWHAFRNSYWPALYFIDGEGRIRHHQYGEGGYAESEKVLQRLLADVDGSQMQEQSLVSPRWSREEAPADITNIRSTETYLGYARAMNFRSPEGLAADRPRNYKVGRLGNNDWALEGDWTVGPEQATLNVAGGAIAYRFSARDLHLVIARPPGTAPIRFRVTLDGKELGSDHGSDTDATGNGAVTETRLYQLVRQQDSIRARTFRIEFLDPGAQVYVFTFG